MVVKMLVVGPFASNCYIVRSSSTKEGMIIDPGAEAVTIWLFERRGNYRNPLCQPLDERL
jgi:hypothetical protein